MSFATIIKASDQETEMAIQNGSDDDRKKSNPGLCMSAGIKTPSDDDDDQKRFQRRHFPYKMSSDIFFCDLSSEDIASSSENSANPENLNPSAGMETRHDDQKQSEKRHFQLPPEDCMQTGDSANGDGDEQVDSAGTSESTDVEIEADDADQKPTQRRHFHDKTSSNIFFCGLPEENAESRNPSDFRKRKG